MNLTRICIGTGLVALDVVLNGKSPTSSRFVTGGSCGNVLTILSFLGWNSFPISRLANNKATEVLEDDLKKWNVNTKLISKGEKGSTPIIIHRILKDKNGLPKHRFEFKDPDTGKWFPRYKPVLSKKVGEIEQNMPTPQVYYFDRMNRGAIELAKISREKGAIVVFEPSSMKDIRLFSECLEIADVIKFSNDRIKNYKELFPKKKVTLEIETLGQGGLNFRYNSNNWNNVEAHSLDDVIDTAGAGDWCTAGLIYALGSSIEYFDNIEEEKIRTALRYGQALGAINCMFSGARGTMYNLDRHALELAISNLEKNATLSLKEMNLKNDCKSTELNQIETLF